MSEKIEKVMEEVKALTVLELNELVKALTQYGYPICWPLIPERSVHRF